MKTGGKASPRVEVDDDGLLIIALFRKKFFGFCDKSSAPKILDRQSKSLQLFKSQKGNRELLPRSFGRSRKRTMDRKRFIMGARTTLSWLIKMGSISLNDTVELRNAKNKVVKDGWVTREGIFCNCCSRILSISEFKAHTGFEEQSSPLVLFLQSGKPYVLCQLEAWSTELKVRKNRVQVIQDEEADQNDDFCALCGADGVLVCCDNCPSSYHQSCLSAQELPEGSWYCRNCICMTCGDVAEEKQSLIPLAVLECSQCGHKYHEACMKRRVPCNVEVGSREWFCEETCQEVYMGFCSRVGVVNHIGDGFSWTILRRSHVGQKDSSKEKLALTAECNAKLAISLTLMEECFDQMVDPRTGIDMIPHVIYNWGSRFARLNYQGFYVVVLEKADALVSVASIRVHGARVAEVPFIATCNKHRRQGMARSLINSVEKELPEGSWYCRNCICMTCGDVAEEKESLISLAVLECSQCGHKYHETCIKRRVPCNVEVGSREWFCEETCQEAVQINFFRGFRFSIAWWAYTFPMTGAAIATINYSAEVNNWLTESLSVTLSAISTFTVSALLVSTALHAFVFHDLFPNDVSIAIKVKKKCKSIKKKHSHWRNASSDVKDIESCTGIIVT